MQKIKEYLPIVAIALMLLGFLQNCGTKGKIKSLKKSVDSLTNVVIINDSLISNTVSEDDLQLIIEREGLKISKRNLYDQNYIIRTTVRPDDKMNEYDKEIKLINKKLK